MKYLILCDTAKKANYLAKRTIEYLKHEPNVKFDKRCLTISNEHFNIRFVYGYPSVFRDVMRGFRGEIVSWFQLEEFLDKIEVTE